MTFMEKCEQLLLQIAIFLIPTNLAYHWYINSAYVNGRLIDYLLPKLYLSDLPILILICIDAYSVLKKKNNFLKMPLPILVLVAYLCINAALSGSSVPSVWYVTKVIEFILFSRYLLHKYTRKSFFNVIRIPIMGAIIVQTILGLYQYITHSSLIGYTFLGEPNLQNLGIAQTSIRGSLEVMPYGTTPHPNVLAGFLVIAIALLVLSIQLSPIAKEKKAFNILLISLSGIVLAASESISAISGAIIISSLILIRKYVSNHAYRLIVLMYICGSLIISLLFTTLLYHSSKHADNHSIVARYELDQAAFSVIKQAPLTGVGPNLFAKYVPKQTFQGQRTLFLQPVHHIGLLIWSETGLLGLILIVWCLNKYGGVIQANNQHDQQYQYLYTLPLFTLVLIGSWDHYPLTLQTGQILTTLALTIPLLRKS